MYASTTYVPLYVMQQFQSRDPDDLGCICGDTLTTTTATKSLIGVNMDKTDPQVDILPP